jgi:histidinol-phosphate aminotransferase
MRESSLAALLRPELAELTAYVPEPGEYAVRLDANEAPPLLSGAARALLAQAAADTLWERYPDATVRELRQAIADACATSPEEVLCGVGSDEIITLLVTALSVPRGRAPVATVLTTTPTFVMYRMSARVRGLRVIEVPLDDTWDLATDSLLQALELVQPNLVFIASPNNPTGNLMRRDRLERVIDAAREALVVVDEAYVAYAPTDQLDLYRSRPNVAVMRTLSKVGFASLRLGWLLGHPDLVRELDKVRLPYNVPTLSQRLATVALRELGDEMRSTAQAVKQERDRLAVALGELGAVAPSDANFLWLRTERPAGEVFEGLARRGVLVRSFHRAGGRLAHQLRVTVGTREENDAFLKALREVA